MKYFVLIISLSLVFQSISLEGNNSKEQVRKSVKFPNVYGTLKGRVVDEDGKPVVGATVRIMGTNNGTYVKDPKGNYEVVKIKPGTYKVKVSYIGFLEVIKEVEIKADSISFINIELKERLIQDIIIDYIPPSMIMVKKDDIGTIRTWSQFEIRTYGGYFWGK